MTTIQKDFKYQKSEKKSKIRTKFWDELKEVIKAKSVVDFRRAQSYYSGYLHGLLIARIITEKEEIEMEKRLTTIILYEIKEKDKRIRKSQEE